MLKHFTVSVIVCTALFTTGCVQRRKPIMVRGPGPRTAVISWQQIKAEGGTCASGTGGMTCTDKNGGQWQCPSNGGDCWRTDD